MMYLRLAGILIVTAAVVTALWYRAQVFKAEARVAQVEANWKIQIEANGRLYNTIQKLQAEREADNKLLAAMAAEVTAISEKMTEANSALSALREENASAREYLDTPLPPELERLLNN